MPYDGPYGIDNSTPPAFRCVRTLTVWDHASDTELSRSNTARRRGSAAEPVKLIRARRILLLPRLSVAHTRRYA